MSVLVQYVFNGLMLGMIYAMVAVGFTLFFGVLDVIKFSHGDILMVGAFAGLTASLAMTQIGVTAPALQLLAVVLFSVGAVLFLNGLWLMGKIADREIIVINIVTALVSASAVLHDVYGAGADGASIRNGTPIYNYEESVKSNLTGILGRTAAYKNREVTWEEMMKADEKWTSDLKLAW